jgi:predicted NUDIX family phosphoesterase
MSIQNTTTVQPASIYPEEHILVVSREKIFADIPAWNGIISAEESIIKTILNEHHFYPRELAEEDPNFKQIIPYMVFKYNDSVFIMQRSKKAGEKRLAEKYTLGIGGHIRKEDTTAFDIIAWGMREFEEEVNYAGAYSISILGLINDDNNDVGKVHLGCAILLEGTSEDISIKEELAWGELIPIDECIIYYDQMETWSQWVFDLLRKEK